MRRAYLVALFAGAVVTTTSLAGAATTTPAGSPDGLTHRGRMLWHFEALLRDEFSRGHICTTRTQNFVSGSCAPLSTYRPYSYVFATARGSAFHVSRRGIGSLGPYNRPGPVLIRNRLIACDADETRILWTFTHAAAFALDCVRAPR